MYITVWGHNATANDWGNDDTTPTLVADPGNLGDGPGDGLKRLRRDVRAFRPGVTQRPMQPYGWLRPDGRRKGRPRRGRLTREVV